MTKVLGFLFSVAFSFSVSALAQPAHFDACSDATGSLTLNGDINSKLSADTNENYLEGMNAVLFSEDPEESMEVTVINMTLVSEFHEGPNPSVRLVKVEYIELTPAEYREAKSLSAPLFPESQSSMVICQNITDSASEGMDEIGDASDDIPELIPADSSKAKKNDSPGIWSEEDETFDIGDQSHPGEVVEFEDIP